MTKLLEKDTGAYEACPAFSHTVATTKSTEHHERSSESLHATEGALMHTQHIGSNVSATTENKRMHSTNCSRRTNGARNTAKKSFTVNNKLWQ